MEREGVTELKLDADRLVIPVAAVRTRASGDLEESWDTRVLLGVVPEYISDDELADALGMGEFYGGPGQGFASRPRVHRTKTRTLISQSGGLDI